MISDKLIRSFWDKVQITDTCWIWTGSKNSRGRGVFHPSACKKLGISYLAYRVSWIIHYGAIPTGKQVCHTCDNPSCVNPEHLFLGSAKDNTLDMLKKGRSGKTKLVAEQVLLIREDPRPRRVIAKEFNVTLNMIQKIKSKRSWKHL